MLHGKLMHYGVITDNHSTVRKACRIRLSVIDRLLLLLSCAAGFRSEIISLCPPLRLLVIYPPAYDHSSHPGLNGLTRNPGITLCLVVVLSTSAAICANVQGRAAYPMCRRWP